MPSAPLAGAGALFVASLCVSDPKAVGISLAPDFHVGVIRGHVFFYNDGSYGPYTGSVVGLTGSEYPKVRGGFGYWAGIYYRHFVWPDYELWTLAVCVAWLMLPGAVVNLAWWMSRHTAKARSRMHTNSGRINHAGPNP
jgi:hypothetical protein